MQKAACNKVIIAGCWETMNSEKKITQVEKSTKKSSIFHMQLEAKVRAAGDVMGLGSASADQCMTSTAALSASSRKGKSGQ